MLRRWGLALPESVTLAMAELAGDVQEACSRWLWAPGCSPVRYVIVYAFQADASVHLVYTGWNTDEAYDALCAGLAAAGTGIADVRG